VTVLQATELAQRCLLSEVLTWLALNRLPLAIYSLDGDEFRFSPDNELCALGSVGHDVTDSECETVGLPLNPRSIAYNEDKHFASVEFYDSIERR
jgi:hypothetical protein